VEERIKVSNLVKRFGTFTAVHDVSFTVHENEFFSLLGPSGCGKTTTLRCISGLEQPTEGEIYISGQLVTSPEKNVMVPPERRGIGMVFQNYAVWPHMTVEQNMSYPLRLARKAREQINAKMAYLLDLLELEGLERGTLQSSPAGSSSALRWGELFPPTRRLCCLTSPSPTSTRNCESRCALSSKTFSARREYPFSTSLMIRLRPWPCQTGLP
jgi:ABC-type glutathione transport system ATPase component